ncbi:MAG: aminotransferase class V-fold PLP-dependent enzyme [Gemmatimonadales bacterium]
MYLNTASITLMYAGALQALVTWFDETAASGTTNFDEHAEQTVFEELRRATARLFNAQPADIAVGSSATELLASLAWAVSPGAGENVVGTDAAFPSVVFPWARVARETGAEVRLARSHDLLVDAQSVVEVVDDNTSVVCISEVEYASGQRYDVKWLAEVAHEHGALLVVDATQSAGAFPIDVTHSGADAVVSAGYKWLCGPFGAAIMYLAPALQGRLDPGTVGFRSHKDMWDLRADRLDLPAAARRFEPSTMAYGCAIGLAAAVEYLLSVGVEQIAEHNHRLVDMVIEGVRARGGEIVTPELAEQRASIVAGRFPNKTSDEVARLLGAAGVIVSSRNGVVRWSPHLFNDEGDIERMFEVFDGIAG